MAYNGSGTFLINTAGQPVVAGTVISSTTFNALTADLATGLSTVITKDGQTTVTANIPMASFKFTGLGVGSAATDSATLSQVQSTVTKLLASVSGTDTVTATASPTLTAYAAGQMFYLVAAGDNTTSVTLNIDALGAKAVTRDGSVALAAADIKSGEVVVVVYDGTRFQVVSQLNSAGNATFANVSITSALNVGGIATFSAGSAAAPSITTTGDTNTGLFFPAADTIAFTEGGVESLRIDSSANVGIGTTSPTAKLTVNDANGIPVRIGDIAAAPVSQTAVYVGVSTSALSGGNGDLVLIPRTSDARSILFYTGNGTASLRATIDSSGNLGLGVTPSAWTTFTSALEVPGGALAGISANQVGVWQNCFYNSSSFKYISTAGATLYQQAGSVHAWYNAPSGTAGNTISFTQAMTLDASGRLGLGTTSPSRLLHLSSASDVFMQVDRGAITSLFGTDDVGAYVGTQTSNAIRFISNAAERARITSGGLVLLNTSSAFLGTRILQVDGGSGPAGAFKCSTAASECLDLWNSATSGDNVFVEFQTDGGNGRGTISYNRTAGLTSYNTTSDVRLKDNIANAADSGDKVDAIKVRQFDWKETGNHVDYGFVAQELHEIAPHSVTKPEDDEKMWSVDYSKLVPMLVKELQSLRKRVAELESK